MCGQWPFPPTPVRIVSFWWRCEALLQCSPNSSLESWGALSARVLLIVLSPTLILGTLARGWWNLSQFDPVQSVQKPPEMFWQWFPIPRAPSAWNSTFILAPLGFGVTKSQLGLISQKLLYLLKADVERGCPARGQGLNPLLPYICVYRFHNAAFGTECRCVCSSPKPTFVISSQSSPAHVIWGFVNCKLCAPKLGFPGR